MEVVMKLGLNSGLFSVYGPDLYWIFDGLCDWMEESESVPGMRL
jgi:hypothetical protein